MDSITNDVNVINLSAFLQYEGLETAVNKYDLSEVVEMWPYGTEAFKGALLYYGDRGSKFFNNEMEIF